MSRYDQLITLIAVPTDDCIVWPYAKNNSGYGSITVDGRVVGAHVVALSTMSQSPTIKHQAAHGPCNNRACVNPRHLSWKTNSENKADKVRDGTDNRGEKHNMAKLSWDDVVAIRWMAAHTTLLHREIGALFGVSQASSNRIINHQTWRTTQ